APPLRSALRLRLTPAEPVFRMTLHPLQKRRRAGLPLGRPARRLKRQVHIVAARLRFAPPVVRQRLESVSRVFVPTEHAVVVGRRRHRDIRIDQTKVLHSLVESYRLLHGRLSYT